MSACPNLARVNGESSPRFEMRTLTRAPARPARLDALFLEGLAFPSRTTLAALSACHFRRMEPENLSFCTADVPSPLKNGFLAHAWRLLRTHHVPDTHAEVRAIPDDHPAAAVGGRGASRGDAPPAVGIFARVPVPAYTPLAVYGGELVDEDECELRNKLPGGTKNAYVFGLDASASEALSVDAGSQPRCIGSCFNHYENILDAPNCTSIEIMCGGGCLCRCGSSFPAVTHPHIVIYTIVDVAAGQELCIDYGSNYCRLMGMDPVLTTDDIVRRVLNSNMATRRAALNALKKDLPLIDPPFNGVYLSKLQESDDPEKYFCDMIDNFRTFSGKSMPISTAVAVSGDSSFGFSLQHEISAQSFFQRALQNNFEVAASFLEQFQRAAISVPLTKQDVDQEKTKDIQADDQNPPPIKRKRGRPPKNSFATLVNAATEAAGAGAGASAGEGAGAGAGAGAGEGSGAGADSEADPDASGFLCYKAWVTHERLKKAFEERIKTEPENTKGFWTRIADDVGIPTLQQCPTATGRAGSVHKHYCDIFNHPFISANGTK